MHKTVIATRMGSNRWWQINVAMVSRHTMAYARDQPGKSTRFLTNSPCVAKPLTKRCPNWEGDQVHNHVRLENGRVGKAQEYPDGLCRAISRGIQQQIKADNAGQFLLMNVEQGAEDDGRSLTRAEKELKRKYKTVEENNDDELEVAWGDVSGAALNPKAVRKDRQEEIEYVRKIVVV